MTDNDFEARRAEVAELLEGVLADGDEFLVRCRDGDIEVVETGLNLRFDYPELYGKLLRLNERLNQAGGCLAFGGLTLAVLFCVGLHNEWWDDWLPAGVADALRNGWVYAGILLGTLILLGFLGEWLSQRVYRRFREELLEALAAARLDRDILLAAMKDDADVAKVAEQLKRDEDAGRSWSDPGEGWKRLRETY